jgi:hypothetical protein
VRFQCERLAIIRARRSRFTVWSRAFVQRFFFMGTCWVVWWKHRHTLRAGGYGYAEFREDAKEELEEAIALMDPRNYVFGPVADARASAAGNAAVAG